MNLRTPLATAAVVDLPVTSGCAVMRGQATVGAYDVFEDKSVDSAIIKAETTI